MNSFDNFNMTKTLIKCNSFVYCNTVTIMVGQYNTIWKYAMRHTTLQNDTFILPVVVCTNTFHIQHTELLAPKTVILHASETNGCIRYTSKMASRIKRCGPTYIIQALV